MALRYVWMQDAAILYNTIAQCQWLQCQLNRATLGCLRTVPKMRVGIMTCGTQVKPKEAKPFTDATL